MALESDDWNAIRNEIRRFIPPKTMTFARVIKRDVAKKLIWTKEHGETSIPLVAFNYSFQYYDTQPTGDNVVAGVPLPTNLVKKEDKLQQNPNLLTNIVVPKVGQTAVIFEPYGNQLWPVCVGVVLSTGHWVGE